MLLEVAGLLGRIKAVTHGLLCACLCTKSMTINAYFYAQGIGAKQQGGVPY
jgi:hypothetical protein